MLLLLSPAKSLDETSPVAAELRAASTRPLDADRSFELIVELRERSLEGLQQLMGISPALAALNAARYADWRPSFPAASTKPAVLLFDGDVYGGLDARSLPTEALLWAQDHLAILSGLHGLLRPLDRIHPYRLEMGTRLDNPHGADLIAFWGERIARRIDRAVAGHVSPVVVNLASDEYFDAVARSPRPLKARTIKCVFQEAVDVARGGSRGAAAKRDAVAAPDDDDASWRIVGLHAKRARGLMARHVVAQRIETPAGLERFAAEGYRFAEAVSTADRLVFRRARAPVATRPSALSRVTETARASAVCRIPPDAVSPPAAGPTSIAVPTHGARPAPGAGRTRRRG